MSSLRSETLAAVLADRGAIDEALREATRLVEGGRERQTGPDEGRGRWVRAEILRRQGQLDEAELEARMAVHLLQTAPLDELSAMVTLSAIWLAQGRAADALGKAEEAMAKYEALRAFGYRGACARLVHAEALHATGDHKSARAAIATARDRLLQTAARIRDREVRQGFLRNVPDNARILELARQWLGPEDSL